MTKSEMSALQGDNVSVSIFLAEKWAGGDPDNELEMSLEVSEAITAAFSKGRQAGLEEGAKVCDSVEHKWEQRRSECAETSAAECAAAIRSHLEASSVDATPEAPHVANRP